MRYQPKTKLEEFGVRVYNLLVENFPSTFFVGGTVRDILLQREVTDIDIATSARPKIVIEILKKHSVEFSSGFKNLGVITATNEEASAAVATFRKESYSGSRYPKIAYVSSVKIDSKRRDFTINSLYLSLKLNKILDFYNGLEDLRHKRIRFIGDPKIKIQEDPLRIIRALRFSLALGFKIENKSFIAIKNKFGCLKNLTKSRINSELVKFKTDDDKKIILKVLDNEKNLDKYFKTR